MQVVKNSPIHIAFCVNDGYVPYMLVSIRSIIDNNQSSIICIHILTDYVSLQMQSRIDSVVAGEHNIRYEIHQVADDNLKGLYLNHWAIYAWYRVLLPEILPKEVHKVLYLDADTLVLDDLNSVMNTEMSGKAIAGSTDVYIDAKCERLGYSRNKGYICSGVLLMNLDYWRKHNLTSELIKWAKEHESILRMPDQDTINVVCKNTKIILPLKYGIQKCFFIDEIYYKDPSLARELRECIEHPAIIHYAGSTPWIKEVACHPFQKDWEKYNAKIYPSVRAMYITKGWKRFKMHVWYAFHPNKRETIISKSEILQKLTENVV